MNLPTNLVKHSVLHKQSLQQHSKSIFISDSPWRGHPCNPGSCEVDGTLLSSVAHLLVNLWYFQKRLQYFHRALLSVYHYNQGQMSAAKPSASASKTRSDTQHRSPISLMWFLQGEILGDCYSTTSHSAARHQTPLVPLLSCLLSPPYHHTALPQTTTNTEVHSQPLTSSPGSSQDYSFYNSCHHHHPTSEPNMWAAINRFKERLSSLTTCFIFAGRHESKQNHSTLAWLQRIRTFNFFAAFASLSIVFKTHPQAPESSFITSFFFFLMAVQSEWDAFPAQLTPHVPVRFPSVPSWWTHSSSAAGGWAGPTPFPLLYGIAED